MFANPIWSALLLAAPIVVWFTIIRPRLKTSLSGVYSHIDSFFGRIRARLYAFRTFWVGVLGAVITALPDILVIITPIDFSPFLPQPWPAYTGPATSIAIVLMKAFETKPHEDQ